MSFFHNDRNRTITSPLRKISRKKPPTVDGHNDASGGRSGQSSNNTSNEHVDNNNGHANGSSVDQDESRRQSQYSMDESTLSSPDNTTAPASRKQSTSSSNHMQSHTHDSRKHSIASIPEDATPVDTGREHEVKENPGFNPSPREVGNGTGIFEKGDASHEISSKEDYELCKEQVTSDSAVDKVTDHFKLVRDLKPLDATAGMDADLDKRAKQEDEQR